MTTRRQFVQGLPVAAAAMSAAGTVPLRPRRLQVGDTVALVSPANATFEREPLNIATEALQAMGFKVRWGAHVRGRYGHFGGTDAQRAHDINTLFADDSVAGILALTGGSGCNRILDRLDYAQMARTPKFFGGFSDITALLNAMQRQAGLVTFHCPVGESEWNAFSVAQFRAVVMQAQVHTLRNPQGERGDHLVQTQDRISTLSPGVARGRLVGGNLSVLASLAGTPYAPDYAGALLFLEEVNEYIYRVDRLLSTLRLSGALTSVAGVVLGKFTRCEPGEGRHGTLTLEEVFDDYLLPLDVPVFRGAMIGHIRHKFTVPVGLMAQMDANAGTVQLLEPAVL